MARLNGSEPRATECEQARRGQLLLVGGIVLALTFIALAIVVNSAIFTENLATRGDVPGAEGAIEYRHETVQAVGGILAAVNDNESIGPDTIEPAVENISVQGGLQQSRQGRVVNITYLDRESGVRVADNSSGDFTDPSGNTTWTVAEDVSMTRNVQFEFESLRGNFTVVLNETDSSSYWNMTVTKDNNLTVEVNQAGESPRSGTCQTAGNLSTVDVTGATVNGAACQALEREGTGEPLWFGYELDEYNIEFENATAADGDYSMIVGDTANVDEAEFDNDDGAVYSVSVTYRYRTSAVRYETEVRVAPGEAPP